MVGDQTVKEVDIVLAESAEVLELVDGGALQGELRQATGLLGFVALGARGSEAVGAQVLADIGRVGGVIVGISRRSISGLRSGVSGVVSRPCETMRDGAG